MLVDEADAEAFAGSVLCDELAEAFYAFAGGCYVGEDDVEGGVFAYACDGHGVGGEGFFVAEDCFGGAHSYFLGVVAGAAPMAVEGVAFEGGVAVGFAGEVAAEGAVFGDELWFAVVGVVVYGEVAGFDGVVVG